VFFHPTEENITRVEKGITKILEKEV